MNVELVDCGTGTPNSLAMAVTKGIKPLLTIRRGSALAEKVRQGPINFLWLGPMEWLADRRGRYQFLEVICRQTPMPGLLGHRCVRLERTGMEGGGDSEFVIDEGGACEGLALLPIIASDEQSSPSGHEFDARFQKQILTLAWPRSLSSVDASADFGNDLRQAIQELSGDVWQAASPPALATLLSSTNVWLPLAAEGGSVTLQAGQEPTRLSLNISPTDTALGRLAQLLADPPGPAWGEQLLSAIAEELRGTADAQWFSFTSQGQSTSPARGEAGPPPADGAWQLIDRLRQRLERDGRHALAAELAGRVLEPTAGDPPRQWRAAQALAAAVCPVGHHDPSLAPALVQLLRILFDKAQCELPVFQKAGEGFRLEYDPFRHDAHDLKWFCPLGTLLSPQAARPMPPPAEIVDSLADGVSHLDLSRSLAIESQTSGRMALRARRLAGLTTSGLFLRVSDEGQLVELPGAFIVDLTLKYSSSGPRLTAVASDLAEPLAGGAADQLFLGRFAVDARQRTLLLARRPRVTRFAALRPISPLTDWLSPLTAALDEISGQIREMPPSYQTLAAYAAAADLVNEWPRLEMDELLARIASLGERVQGRLSPIVAQQGIPCEIPGERFPEYLAAELRSACGQPQPRPLCAPEQYRCSLEDGVHVIEFSPLVGHWAQKSGCHVWLQFSKEERPQSVLVLRPDAKQALAQGDAFDMGPFANPVAFCTSPASPASNFNVFLRSTESVSRLQEERIP